jgi:hypothetical protein
VRRRGASPPHHPAPGVSTMELLLIAVIFLLFLATLGLTNLAARR